jgi:hypothetical protein
MKYKDRLPPPLSHSAGSQPGVVERTDFLVGKNGLPLFAVDTIGDFQYVQVSAEGRLLLHDADRGRIESLTKVLQSASMLEKEDRDRIDALLSFFKQFVEIWPLNDDTIPTLKMPDGED